MDKRFGRKALAVVMAGLMGMGGAPMAALAQQAGLNTPDAGGQTGTGRTDLTMVMERTAEAGGTEDTANNPDADGDGLGDNIAFTVPSAINYVVKADGTLVGPATGAAYMENRSAFKIHVSSADVDPESGWSFVADASASTAANSVDLQVGPAADMLQASEYLTKRAVGDASEWNMAAEDGSEGGADRLGMSTEGNVANVAADVTQRTKFGEIHWYVTPGEAKAGPTLYATGAEWMAHLDELKAASEDLAANGTSSPYYATFKGFMDNDETFPVQLGGTIDEMTDVEADKVMNMRIVDIAREDAGGTTHGLTLMAKRSLPKREALDSEGSVGDGYVTMSLRTELNEGTYWSLLPSALQGQIASVTHDSYGAENLGETIRTTDRLWLASVGEIFGGNNDSPQFAFFQEGGDRSGMGVTNSGAEPTPTILSKGMWWTRSVLPDSLYITRVDSSGQQGYSTPDRAYGVVPCFSL